MRGGRESTAEALAPAPGRSEPRWVSPAVARAIHANQVRQHGGRHGLRDGALLESALGRARMRWACDGDADLPALAAAVGHALARNRPFLDGNKRTAFQVMYVFLGLNGLRIEAREPEVVRVMSALAGDSLPETALGDWLRSHTVAR